MGESLKFLICIFIFSLSLSACKKSSDDSETERNSELIGTYDYLDRNGSTCEVSDNGNSVISEYVQVLENGQIIWTKNKYTPNTNCNSSNIQEVSVSKGTWKTFGNEFSFKFTLFSLTPKTALSVQGRVTNKSCGREDWALNLATNSSNCPENVDLINEENSNSYELDGKQLTLNKGASGELTLRMR